MHENFDTDYLYCTDADVEHQWDLMRADGVLVDAEETAAVPATEPRLVLTPGELQWVERLTAALEACVPLAVSAQAKEPAYSHAQHEQA